MSESENFYQDNADLKFVIEQMIDWKALLNMRGQFGTEDSMFENAEEAREASIDMLSDPVGTVAAQRIAPRAEEIDVEGCKLVDGEVVFPEGLKRNLADLRDAQLCGITLSPRYGGIGMSKTFYTAATEIISRADVSLMNFFGLQGIGETIQQFADDESKEKYLPDMASGERDGAMVLTEPDAGSDLAAVRTKSDLAAQQDPVTGDWFITGTKRFITNGCGDVHVVLARSEDPKKYSSSRGLSFFVTDRSCGKIHVRRIEHKLGIHGSPTCELYYDQAPARLIGKRGAGLARYTAWLMSAARLGVAAQGLGISEAALREAQTYANEREQFGKPIKVFPQVARMLTDMRVHTEASRALLFATCWVVDMVEGAEISGNKKEHRFYSKMSDLLTPMSKYYCCEWANRIAYMAIQVHGGNGFMMEYPAQRLYRDARITNIYEGTSQIQIVWAVPRILRGVINDALGMYNQKEFSAELGDLVAQVKEAEAMLQDAIVFLKEKDNDYRDLMGTNLVDLAIDVLIGYIFLHQAEKWDYKKKIATRFIADMIPRSKMNLECIKSDRSMELELND